MKNVTKIIMVLVLTAAIVLPVAALSILRLATNQVHETYVVPDVKAAPSIATHFVKFAENVPQIKVDQVSFAQVNLDRSLSEVFSLQSVRGDKLVLGGTYTLRGDETLDGSLFVLGGIANLEDGSTVEGDAVLLGGTLHAEGRINGDVIVIGGLVDLGETAIVEGDINTLGGQLERSAGAQVEGSVNSGVTGPLPLNVPGRVYTPSFDVNFNPFWDGLWFLFRSFMWAALAVLLSLFLPVHTERAANVVVSQPLVAGGLGLLTTLVAPILLVAIAVTILGIPITLLGIFLFTVAWAFGVVVVGFEIGKRLSKIMNQEWAMAVSAGVGTFLVTVVANGIGKLVPCVGWMVPALVGVVGLGAVILTRFGTQEYSSNGPNYRASHAIDPGSDVQEPPDQPTKIIDLPADEEGEEDLT